MGTIKNVTYRNGQYWVMDKLDYREATTHEVTCAIANATNKDDWATFSALTCPCGYAHFDCRPDICMQGADDD